jgi:exosortase/archaeosortase family protein
MNSSPRRRAGLKFCLLFILWVSLFYSLTTFDYVLRHVNVTGPVTAGVVKSVTGLVKLFSIPVEIDGADLKAPELHLRISHECNGVIAFIIYLSAVLAFPSRFRRKIAGLLIGAVVIWTVNIGRILLLVFVALYLPDIFYQTHIYVAQALVIACAVVLWLLWAHWAMDSSAAGRTVVSV